MLEILIAITTTVIIFYRCLVDELHDDLHILDKVYFDDVLENGIGEFGSLTNLDIPDIDFSNLLHEFDNTIIKDNNWFWFWLWFGFGCK